MGPKGRDDRRGELETSFHILKYPQTLARINYDHLSKLRRYSIILAARKAGSRDGSTCLALRANFAYIGRMSSSAADMDLDWTATQETALLDAAIALVPEHGTWDAGLVRKAGERLGLSQALVALILPNGARDLSALLARRHDAAAFASLAQIDPSSLKVRARVRAGVLARVEAAMADEAAVRHSLGTLVLPSNAKTLADLLWSAADQIWRWAGDTATDLNHYSKRALLSGVIAATLSVRLRQGEAAAEQTLDRAIDGVMQFEKLKSRFSLDPVALAEQAVRGLARVRYGV